MFRMVWQGSGPGNIGPGSVGARTPDWDLGGLLLVQLSQRYNPRRWFIATALSGLVEAEGLQCTGEGEEKQRRRSKDAQVEMELA